MGARISDDRRAAVVQSLQARVEGRPSFREIAAEHGVSETYVRKVGNEDIGPGVVSERARAQVKNAAEATAGEFARRRAELTRRLLDAAAAALDDIAAGSVVTGIAFGEVVSRRVPNTTARDRQALLTAAGIALDKAKMLEQYEQGQNDGSEVGRFLRMLAGGGPDA